MKATRRHDLQDNVLARRLGGAVAFARKNLNWIVAGVLAAVVLVALVFYAIHQRRATRQAEWNNYRSLAESIDAVPLLPEAEARALPGRTREQLRQLVQDTAQEELAAWATVQIGRAAYQELRLLQSQLDQSGVELLASEVRQAYERVLAAYAAHAEPLAQAHLGLGLLAETLGDLETARQHYQAVVAMEGKALPMTVLRANQKLLDLGKWAEPVVFPSTAPAEPLAESPLPGMVAPSLETAAQLAAPSTRLAPATMPAR